jgi:hypothetical protein
VSQLHDSVWTQSDNLVTVDARQYNSNIPAGQSRTLPFRVSATDNVQFHDEMLIAYTMAPQPTTIAIQLPSVITWEETSLVFDVLWTTNLVSGDWFAATNDIVGTSWIAESDARLIYYRILGHD